MNGATMPLTLPTVDELPVAMFLSKVRKKSLVVSGGNHNTEICILAGHRDFETNLK